jgi:sulfur carrier protein
MITVNGQPRPLAEEPTVAVLLAELGVTGEGRGVAVAVDGEVVPRTTWSGHALSEGAKIEILTAVQGG